MAAGIHNFVVEQGVGYSFTIDYKQGNDQPKDLTGFEGRGHIKEKISACDPIASFEIEITNAVEGQIKVSLPHTALTDLKVKGNRFDDYMECVYDIELFKVENDEEVEVIRLLNGVVKISPEVTK